MSHLLWVSGFQAPHAHHLPLTSSALGLVKGYFLIVLIAMVVFDLHPEENNLPPAPNFLLSPGQLSCRMVHIEVCLTGAQLLPLTCILTD